MEKKKVNGYSDGYNYPANYYPKSAHEEDSDKHEIKGSFWVPCREKAIGRHSFCDGE